MSDDTFRFEIPHLDLHDTEGTYLTNLAQGTEFGIWVGIWSFASIRSLSLPAVGDC